MANPKIEIRVKDYGTMTAELYPDMAPITVANFLKLAKEDFFAALILLAIGRICRVDVLFRFDVGRFFFRFLPRKRYRSFLRRLNRAFLRQCRHRQQRNTHHNT